MPTIEITAENGKIVGVDDKAQKAYAKFRARLESLHNGESLIFSWKEPRSGPFHRRHFAMLGAVYNAQEQFTDETQFRKWMEVGAGYADMLPGPKGKPVAVPRSIAYEKLDQVEFEPIHQAVFAFARSLYATRFLWPQLSDAQQAEMIAAILAEFE